MNSEARTQGEETERERERDLPKVISRQLVPGISVFNIIN